MMDNRRVTVGNTAGYGGAVQVMCASSLGVTLPRYPWTFLADVGLSVGWTESRILWNASSRVS